jgi:SEL1 protein
MLYTEPKKDWSWNEWIINFLQDDLYWEEGLPYEDDIYDDGGSFAHQEPGFEAMDEAGVDILLILAVAAALVGLLYYRQNRQQENRRQREEEEQQQQNGGQRQAQGMVMFPQRGDPEFNNWVAGGVGH